MNKRYIEWLQDKRRENNRRYSSQEWRDFAAKRRSYDKSICARCGENGWIINHKEYLPMSSWYTKAEFDQLETLCDQCNKEYCKRNNHGHISMEQIDYDLEKWLENI